jgi:hypothetical protein
MSKIDFMVWLAAPVLLSCLAAIFIRRRLYREFPLFFVYLAAQIVVATLRLSVSGNYRLFFEVYWATEAIYALLTLWCLYEVFHWVFLEFYKCWTWFWSLFPGVIAAAAGAALWYSLEYPVHNAGHLISFIVAFNIAVNLIELSLFALFFGLVWLLGLTWWAYSFAIVLGFAISALGALASYWLFSIFGTRFIIFAKYAPPVAYILAIVFWLTVFVRPEPELKLPAGITPQQLLEEVRQYGGILERLRRILK